MPIYEYDCPKCGRFDVLQRMTDRPLRTHHACGSKVRKVMSPSAFSFKGSGFYATDYKPNGAKKGAKAEPACEKPKGDSCAACPAAEAKA